MEDLKILLFISSTFKDLSIDLNDYNVGNEQMTLVNGSDFIYLGLYKKFKNIYASIISSALTSEVSYEYYNGSSWISLSVRDESKDMAQSGFIKWDLPKDWVTNSVNNEELFYIRLSFDGDIDLNALNMLFSNDNDLTERYRDINEFLGNDTNFVALHQSSRKDIIQKIRNSGKAKVSSVDKSLSDVIIWDFLRPEQLREASAYLTLSKIFSNVSDNIDGKFYQLQMMYYKDYCSSVEVFLNTIDTDDDGEESKSETNRQAITMTRIKYV